jgi:hypothetical protein
MLALAYIMKPVAERLFFRCPAPVFFAGRLVFAAQWVVLPKHA